jgi:hypothetical protein
MNLEVQIAHLSKRERIYARQKHKFNNLSEKEKKAFDADFIFRKLKRNYGKEKFKVVDYYDTKARVVFLSEDSSLLNVWNRQDNDGLKYEFAKFLKKNKLDWSWRSPEGKYSWDGIYIKPKDYTNFAFYYGIDREPKKREVIIDDKTQNIIDIVKNNFSEFGAECINLRLAEGWNSGADRVEFDFDAYNKVFCFHIMYPSTK